jgi:ATP-dependent Clp protease ATP-binding subunit ClpC
MMRDVQKRLGEEEMRSALTPAATEFLVAKGYDENYGARPLKRAIQRYIEDPLSRRSCSASSRRATRSRWTSGPDKDKLEFRIPTSTTTT